MKKLIVITLLFGVLFTSCVSKKKYVALEQNLTDTKGVLQKTTLEKEKLEANFAKIEQRVDEYYSKINSLRDTNVSLTSNLQDVNNEKLVLVDDNLVVLSKNVRDRMNATLSKMSPHELAGATTLKDSINLAISYNLKKKMISNGFENDDDISVKIDKTVVMISVADNLLFKTASYRVNKKAYPLLQKLADVANSELSMDVMIEGHTDSRTINTSMLKDNWDLSVKRATSIVRLLQNKFNIDPSRLIASGRSSYIPLVENDSKENRARNRRTNIIILPNLNKFFALLESEEHILP
ncbi:MAG TPA: cell envelope biogenesis protein OmpA [Lutibacter sp.]|nr:cell envelope biogenesis protein OmpA [Lutibacter sp.]